MGEEATEQVAAPARRLPPTVRTLSFDDIRDVLRSGWSDYRAAPVFGLGMSGLYVAGGWLLFLLATATGLHYIVYPLATGFALIAPFVAAGFYEVSRRLETGAPLSWGAILATVRQGTGRDLGWMALVTCFAFFIWIDIAVFLYAMFFGLKAPSLWLLLVAIFTTAKGLMFFLTGNVIGACIAMFIFSISAISFPMLLDRNVDFVTAMITSVRTVKQNKSVMTAWASIIALLMLLSFATAFAALVIVLPWIGHATWHLYRRAIQT